MCNHLVVGSFFKYRSKQHGSKAYSAVMWCILKLGTGGNVHQISCIIIQSRIEIKKLGTTGI